MVRTFAGTLITNVFHRSQLRALLDAHARASTNGVLPDQRQRWDFSGSFYFVGTVVSTIG